MFQFTELLLFSATILVSLIFTSLLRRNNSVGLRRRYPPSLPSLPLIGSLPFMLKSKSIGLHEFFRHKADQLGPIFTFRVGRSLWLTLSSRKVIEEALLKHSTCFAGREHFYFDSMTNKNKRGFAAQNFTAEFKRYHKLSLSVLREFGLGVGRVMETRIHQEFEAMDAFIRTKQGKEFDPNDMARIGTYNVIKNILFGKREDYENGLDEISQLLLLFIQNITPEIEAAPALLSLLPYFSRKVKTCMKCVSKSNGILKKEIENARKDGNVECFVSSYLAKVGPDYDQEQLVYTARDFILAGFENTSTILLWFFVFVANNPSIQERLQKEIDEVIPRHRLPSLDDQPKLPFVEATILEVMRIRTAVPIAIPHLTLSDSEVCGYFIPARTKVLVNLHAVHMDVKRWKDPNVFRPERFLDEDNNIIGRDGVIPFSMGRRSCLGEILARQEIFLFLAGWIQRFHIQPGEDGRQIDGKPIVKLTMKPRPFKIRMIPRKI